MSDVILSLLDWCAETGRELPIPAEVIADLEAQGHLVDLETGDIIPHGGSIQMETTVIGEATAIVLAHESEVE